MTQPTWKFLANLGDVNPLDYGGLLIYVDETGVYPPELEKIEPIDEDDEASKLEIHRVILDRCTFVDGVLSDNKFHPEHPAWFADRLEAVAKFAGYELDELRAKLCAEEPLELGEGYRTVYDFHGWANGDSEPRTLTRDEAIARYQLGELEGL